MSGDSDKAHPASAEAVNQHQDDAGNHGLSLPNHADLISELYKDFGRIDRQKSGSITAGDVDTFLGRPHLSEDQLELGHFLKDNFSELAKLNGTTGQIKRSDLDHMKEVFGDDNPAPPDPRMVGRSVIGGAIAGGVTSHMQGDTVSSGGSKGAAVGAAVGLFAYGVDEANYKQLLKERGDAASLHYPQARYSDTPVMTDDQIYKLADKPISFDNASAMVEKFRGTLSKIDFDNSGGVTSDELKEAIRSNYIPDDQKPLAAALARNMDELEKLNDQTGQLYGVTDSGLHELALALQPDNHDALHEAKTHRAWMTGIGSGPGAFWGAIIGGAVGNVPGALIGAGIGGSITGGGTFLFQSRDVKKVAQYEDHLRKDVLKNTIHDFQDGPKPHMTD